MRKLLHNLAILALFIWGGLFLYFYLTGRIERHLDPSFRVYALISGIGMILLGAFNFINRNKDVGACDHDHAHGDTCNHDDSHEHSGSPEHHHDHKSDDAEESHDHEHGESCHHGESHSHGHKHSHDEKSAHSESHDDQGHGEGDHDHAHDHEDSTSGLAFSLAVLLIPILMATGISKDQFSSGYLAKWGEIERQMLQMRIAKEREAEAADRIKVSKTAPNPYTREGIEGETPGAADTPPNPDDPTVGVEADAADTDGGENEDWGTFTLEDLKNMVPQSTEGDFLLDVPQIFYTAGDKELMQVMEGIPVETTAQLMEETLSNANGQRLKAFRLFIECCAADARPLSIPVDFGKAPPEYVEMGWYKLYGKLHYADEDGEIIPLLNIERIEEVLEPTDGLLY